MNIIKIMKMTDVHILNYDVMDCLYSFNNDDPSIYISIINKSNITTTIVFSGKKYFMAIYNVSGQYLLSIGDAINNRHIFYSYDYSLEIGVIINRLFTR